MLPGLRPTGWGHSNLLASNLWECPLDSPGCQRLWSALAIPDWLLGMVEHAPKPLPLHTPSPP